MTIFDFLDLKNENFGEKYPYKPFLGDFGGFLKNRYFSALIEGGVSLLRILGNIFFPGPVTFLKNRILQKKKK